MENNIQNSGLPKIKSMFQEDKYLYRSMGKKFFSNHTGKIETNRTEGINCHGIELNSALNTAGFDLYRIKYLFYYIKIINNYI